ncbi:hypothetical protein G9A89_001934 [Geosiphon pyriformis]|nr:hypothetical protein G9A89_001934 [Geosiphon pyriformis]
MCLFEETLTGEKPAKDEKVALVAIKGSFSRLLDWNNKLMDSKGEQDCKVMEIIKENSTSKSELNEYGFNV